MARPDASVSLSALARLGFAELSEAAASLAELESLLDVPRTMLLEASVAADPDAAVRGMLRVARRDPSPLRALVTDEETRQRVWRVFGASVGLAEFFLRHPEELDVLAAPVDALPAADVWRGRLLAAVGAEDGFAESAEDETIVALRVAYRRNLAEIAAFDLGHPRPEDVVAEVAASLADLAGAALETSLAIARTRQAPSAGRDAVATTQLAVIGMGKAGARELNYVSDVDVIFVGARPTRRRCPSRRRSTSRRVWPGTPCASSAPSRSNRHSGRSTRHCAPRASRERSCAPRLPRRVLRPMGEELGVPGAAEGSSPRRRSCTGRRLHRCRAAARVVERRQGGVRRERPADARAGHGAHRPGGRPVSAQARGGRAARHRVHGAAPAARARSHRCLPRTRGTLESLDALVAGGYIGRADAGAFAHDYRVLRLMEHRLQLRDLSRTHLMPKTPAGLRILARSTKLADTGRASGPGGRVSGARCATSTPASSTARC